MKKLSLRAAQSAVRGTAPESEVVGLDGTPLPPTPLKETAAREIFSNLDRRPGDFLAMRAVSPGEQDGRIRRAFAGSALLRDEDKLEYLRSVLHQVHEKYRTVNRGFVEIGLILLD